MTYYNTNRETGETLKKSCQKADSQEDKIYKWMKSMYFILDKITPEVIWDWLYYRKIPLTSVRRSLSNLAKEGKVIKLGKDKMVEGLYGKKVHTWQVVIKEGKQLKIL